MFININDGSFNVYVYTFSWKSKNPFISLRICRHPFSRFVREMKRSHSELSSSGPEPKKTASTSTGHLPISDHYEVSYMHRDVVTGVVQSKRFGYILTASEDGVVKFWKRTGNSPTGGPKVNPNTGSAIPVGSRCLEFVKSYRSHSSGVRSLSISKNGETAASVGADGVIKFYDVSTFDVSGMIRLGETAKNDMGPAACFVLKDQSGFAISRKSDNAIVVYDVETLTESKVLSIHPKPVVSLSYNYKYDTLVSFCAGGMIEYIDCRGTDLSSIGGEVRKENGPAVEFSSKFDTDLFDLAKKSTHAVASCISPDGLAMAVSCEDSKVRIFDFRTGKCITKLPESEKVYAKLMGTGALDNIDSIEYGKRSAMEREIKDSPLVDSKGEFDTGSGMQRMSMQFDSTSRYLLYPSLMGIKCIDVLKNRQMGIIGRGDASQHRFVGICLCDLDAVVDKQMELQRAEGAGGMTDETDNTFNPMLVSCSYKQKRLFVFTRLDVVNCGANFDRDILNEQPEAADLIAMTTTGVNDEGKRTSASGAILRTSMGDIHFKLFAAECPRTVENFVVHSQNGYYNDVIFHRVIKGFMLQTGDPEGNGTGGESIWGGEFDDEIHRSLKHDRPFTVSMANAGPGTNGSQFFITTVPTPWLDGKHTVFGRVTKGAEVCLAIENCKTGSLDKPVDTIKILNVDLDF